VLHSRVPERQALGALKYSDHHGFSAVAGDSRP